LSFQGRRSIKKGMKEEEPYIIEDKNILTPKEKEYIENIILGEKLPFYWVKETIHGKGEPCLVHGLIHRKTQQIVSSHADFFKKITKRFADRHKIPCNIFLRGCINLTFPHPERSTPHIDHPFPHYQFLLHLNKSNGGATLILDSKKKVIKTIRPQQFKGFGFKGGPPHCMVFPKSGRRVIAVLTFC